MIVKLFISSQKPFCPLFRKIAHFSGKSPPSEKNTRFGAEKKSEIVPFFYMARSHILNVFFGKNRVQIGQL